MNADKQKDGPWEACKQGELLRMAKRLDARDRRVQMGRIFRAATASMVLVAAGVLMTGFVGGLPGTAAGGIDCAECRESFAAYHESLQPASLDSGSSKADPIDPVLSQSIANHLAQCEHCRRQFHTKFPDILTDIKTPHRLPLLANLALVARTARE